MKHTYSEEEPIISHIPMKEMWQITRNEYFETVPEVRRKAKVLVKDIAHTGGTSREETYVRTTARYRDMLDRMKKYGFEGNIIDPPPVILRRTVSGNLQIEDGNHRVAAAYDAGIKEIPVEIIETPFHSDIVEQAITEGKPVPPEVLADYPYLASLKHHKTEEEHLH